MNGGQIAAVIIFAILTSGASVCALAFGLSARARARMNAPPDFAAMHNRLERIEQAVESVAVEVERVSEAQRFTARLLSERREAIPDHIPAAEGRR